MSTKGNRTLIFQTPKKKTQTPLRLASKRSMSEENRSSESIKSNFSTNSKKSKKEKQKHLKKNSIEQEDNINDEEMSEFDENSLISAYREENNFLRNLKKEAVLYSKLLGITIDQEANIINFSIKRNSSTGFKRLDFALEEALENYIFTLKEAENCSIPEYFYDVIEFNKSSFPQFFYKAMQAVYETRSNEN